MKRVEEKEAEVDQLAVDDYTSRLLFYMVYYVA